MQNKKDETTIFVKLKKSQNDQKNLFFLILYISIMNLWFLIEKIEKIKIKNYLKSKSQRILIGTADNFLLPS